MSSQPNSSNIPSTPVINASKVINVTPTISTSAYATGNQLGSIMQVPAALRQNSTIGYGIAELVNVVILDESAQSSPIDVWFFNQSPTLTSTDNTAFAMTAANFRAQFIGCVQLGASGSYSSAAAVSACSAANLNLVLSLPGPRSAPLSGSAPAYTNLYAVAIARGTPTYTTTTALTFLFGFFQD